MFNLEELQEAMENLEKSRPSKEDIHVAFDRELALLIAQRDEINADIARREYLRLVINRGVAVGIYCPEGDVVFMSRLFHALLRGKATVVGIQPDLTISPVVYKNGRYQFDDVDLGHMVGSGDVVHYEGIYTDGVKSDLMVNGELVIDGLSLAK